MIAKTHLHIWEEGQRYEVLVFIEGSESGEARVMVVNDNYDRHGNPLSKETNGIDAVYSAGCEVPVESLSPENIIRVQDAITRGSIRMVDLLSERLEETRRAA